MIMMFLGIAVIAMFFTLGYSQDVFAQEEMSQIPNPAAVYCIDNGGTLSTQSDGVGEHSETIVSSE